MWQKCPVCNGTGLVSRPPWVAGDMPGWSSTGTGPYPCRTCGGTGTLWAPSEYHTIDSPKIEPTVPTPEYEELKTRAEQAEAKLRNLAQAEVWRNRCFNAMDRYLSKRNTYVYKSKDWKRWNRAFWRAVNLLEKAKENYQAALKAIVE